MAKRKSSKTILLGNGVSLVGSLKEALSRCHDDSKIEVKLCIGEEKQVDFQVEKLKDICRRLYSCLSDARNCVELVANMEKKQNLNLIYYDKFRGFNGGARDLLGTVEKALDNYPREMIQVELEG